MPQHTIEVYTATTQPKFKLHSENRVLIKSQNEFNTFITHHFGDITSRDPIANKIAETSVLEMFVQISYNDIESVRNTQYILVKINNETRLYFVDRIVINNNDTANIYCFLDTISTYFYKLKFGRSADVVRQHHKRFLSNGALNINNKSPLTKLDPDISLSQKTVLDVRNFEIEKDEDKTFYEEIRSKLTYPNGQSGTPDTFNWAVVIPSDNDIQHPGNEPLKYITQYGLYNSLILMGVLSNKPPATNDIIISGKTIDKNSSLADNALTTSPKVNSIISTKLPITDNNGWSGLETKALKLVENAQDVNNKITVFTTGRAYWKTCDLKLENLTPSKPSWYGNEEKTFDEIWNLEPKIYTDEFYSVNFRKLGGSDIKPFSTKNLNDPSKLNLQPYYYFNPSSASVLFYIKDLPQDWNDEGWYEFDNSESLPLLNDNYTNFINNSMNTVNQGINAAKVRGAIGMIGGGVAAGVGMASGNPLAILGGIGAGANGIANILLTEQKYQAQMDDLGNSPVSVKSGTNNAINSKLREISNNSIFEIDVVIQKHADYERKSYAYFFHKFGYFAPTTKKFTSPSDFKVRKQWNYWKIKSIDKALSSYDNIPLQALDDITLRFHSGIRLWEPQTEIDNYELGNGDL